MLNTYVDLNYNTTLINNTPTNSPDLASSIYNLDSKIGISNTSIILLEQTQSRIEEPN
ncbi:hypothetical protein [Candidatus Vesicomyidisocius sp. SY067_SCS001]|uniref:hypothetical protein n=1 Tax=Candidatus Vesicomyidisocius sp. SY067_SCS001 TaxID=2732590 RepID=UPI0016865D7E|nr:hypothetical protein [Candidatus Vesicomyosocius sp. SY067_SCS001]